MNVIDETQGDIARIIATDFGFRPGPKLEDDFTNWLHYRARRIPTLPRHVRASTKSSACRMTFQR